MSKTIFFRVNELKIIQENAFQKCKDIDINVKKEFEGINSLNQLYYQANVSPFSTEFESGIREASSILQETPYMTNVRPTYTLEKIEDFTQTDSILTSQNFFWLTLILFLILLLIKFLKLKLRFTKYFYYLFVLLLIVNIYNFSILEPNNLQKIKENYNFVEYKKDSYQFYAKEKTLKLSE